MKNRRLPCQVGRRQSKAAALAKIASMFSSNATKMPGSFVLAGGADEGLQREHGLAGARATHDERGAIARQPAEADLVESLDTRQALLQYLAGALFAIVEGCANRSNSSVR